MSEGTGLPEVVPRGEQKLAGLTRLELATFRVTGGRSDQTELQPHSWLLGQDSNL